MTSTLTDNELLSAGFLAAERHRPYFATGLSAMTRRFGPVPTFAITPTNVLIIGVEFMRSLDAKQIGEVLTHEMLHVLRRHYERSCAIPNVDREVYGIAADLELNDDLDRQLLPEGGVFPDMFGLKPGLMVEEYYAELLKQKQQQQQGQGSGKKGKDGKEPGVTGGKCGSGSGGEKVDGEPEGAEGAKGRTEADMNRIRREVAEAIIEAAKSQGNMPGGFLRMAEGEIKPPKIRWEEKLRRAIRTNVAMVAGRVDYSRMRPNRRQSIFNAAAKARGGRAPLIPSLVAPRPTVAFGVDTSGSMGQEELMRAVSEADGVIKSIGAPVIFLACDCACTEPVVVRTARELAGKMQGGGGTSFIPIFKAVEEMRPRPSVFIFVTDGMGPAPEKAPAGFETIWVFVGEYATPPCTWGTQIQIEHDKKD